MKKVFKINLAAALALFMGFGLMSFKMVSHTSLANQWYPVEATGQIDLDNPINSPDDLENCEAPLDHDICAVELQPSDPYTNTNQIPSGTRTMASFVDPVLTP